MYEGKVVGVVVPAYNEEGFVGTVVETMPSYVDRVYVVDDCSTDGTWEEIREAAATANAAPAAAPLTDGGARFERRVVPIRHERNRGVGGAIKTGYLRALDDGIDVTAVMGGDAQMDPDILDRVIDPVVEGRADYAKGNRLLYPEYRRGMSRWRFFGNSVLSFLTKIASGYWKMMDPQNGYTAISREALERVRIEEMYEYYGYCNDLLVKLNARGMRVADVPVPAIYGDEESSIIYSKYIRHVSVMLLGNFLWRLKVKYLVLDFHPLALFYYAGAVGASAGIFGMLYAVWTLFSGAGSAFLQGAVSALVFAVGVLSLLFAMVFDMQANQHLEVQEYD